MWLQTRRRLWSGFFRLKGKIFAWVFVKIQLVTIPLKSKTKFNLFEEKVESGSGPFTNARSGSGPNSEAGSRSVDPLKCQSCR
jgi:hypothetical protein